MPRRKTQIRKIQGLIFEYLLIKILANIALWDKHPNNFISDESFLQKTNASFYGCHTKRGTRKRYRLRIASFGVAWSLLLLSTILLDTILVIFNCSKLVFNQSIIFSDDVILEYKVIGSVLSVIDNIFLISSTRSLTTDTDSYWQYHWVIFYVTLDQTGFLHSLCVCICVCVCDVCSQHGVCVCMWCYLMLIWEIYINTT